MPWFALPITVNVHGYSLLAGSDREPYADRAAAEKALHADIDRDKRTWPALLAFVGHGATLKEALIGSLRDHDAEIREAIAESRHAANLIERWYLFLVDCRSGQVRTWTTEVLGAFATQDEARRLARCPC
jgi:hypothetical protein